MLARFYGAKQVHRPRNLHLRNAQNPKLIDDYSLPSALRGFLNLFSKNSQFLEQTTSLQHAHIHAYLETICCRSRAGKCSGIILRWQRRVFSNPTLTVLRRFCSEHGEQTVDVSSETWRLLEKYEVPAVIKVRRHTVIIFRI